MKDIKKKEEKNEFEFFTELEKKENKIIPELTFKNIQMEMLLFKNDILKDINELTRDLTEKHITYDFLFKDEIKKINNLLTNTENKIKDLSNLVSIDKETKRKLESLLEFKKKTEEYVITNDIRYNNLEKDVNENVFRHDSIFKDTVIYPGVIGPMCKFKNFHELVDYFINEIMNLIKYKEKNEIDLSLYKSKLDTMILGFKLQIDNFMKTSTQFTRKTVNQAEERIHSLFLKYDDIINVNRIQCCKNATDLENKIIDYKILNEDLIKNITEETNKLNNKINKLQKEMQDKFNDFNKKQNKNDYNNDFNNKRFNRTNYRNIRGGAKVIKSASSVYEKEEKINKKPEKKEIKESKEKDNNEIKKTNNTNEANESRTSSQINNDIKSLELKLQTFIKNEISNLSRNIHKSLKSFKDTKTEEKKEKITNRNINININKEDYSSKDSDKQLIIKTDIEQNQKKEFITVSPKRKSCITSDIPKKVFEQFVKKREEKKHSKKYIFEKIKEVFYEDSNDNEDFENDIKIEKIKKRNTNFTIPKLPENVYITDIKRELNFRKTYNSTKILPIFSKFIKQKQGIKNKKLKFDAKSYISPYKNIIKFPIKKKLFKQTQTSPQKEEKDLTPTNNNEKKPLSAEEQNKGNNKEFKMNSSSRKINHPFTVQPKKPKIKLEIKEDLIKTPEVKRNNRLSNFAITLQGTKKVNVEPLERFMSDKIYLNINSQSPTLYMNFPKKQSQFSERLLESLNPIYRNIKFSKYIRPYISSLTNNYLTKLKHNEKKTMSQKKVRLPSNKSENNLIKSKVLKINNNKEIKLPDIIIDEEVEKNTNHYSPGFNEKYKTLEEKDSFSSNTYRNNIQDVYLNKDNRFNMLNINEGAKYINLKKKV